jgi:WhiB family redox-sensing transcriptional regulator
MAEPVFVHGMTSTRYDGEVLANIETLLSRPAWMADAPCHGLAEMFYADERTPPGQKLLKQARAICARCPVLDRCRAASTGERHGFWAGMTEHERKLERRRQRAA